MRLIYVLLSPTFGMHQYTADLANRIAETGSQKPAAGSSAPAGEPGERPGGGVDAALVTTTTLPRDRYSPAVHIETPITSHGTGFAGEGLDVRGYRRVSATIGYQLSAMSHAPTPKSVLPAIVHFTGVHLWNVPLVYALRRHGIP